MLRTCSEPDMTKLFHDEISDKDNQNKVPNESEETQFKKSFSDDSNKNKDKQFGTIRLARSLEDGLDDNKDDRLTSEEVVIHNII